jgi:hypothetical protein
MITDGEIADACNKEYIKAGHNAYFGNGFEAGVRFALEQLKNCSIPAVIKSCETCSKLGECKIVQSCKERGNTHCAYFEHVL